MEERRDLYAMPVSSSADKAKEETFDRIMPLVSNSFLIKQANKISDS